MPEDPTSEDSRSEAPVPAAASGRRLVHAGLTLLAWIAATVVLGALTRPQAIASMADVVAMLSSQLMLGVLAGILVLGLATRLFRWGDLGFVAPRWGAVLRLSWFPILTLLPFPILAYALGLPPPEAIAILALNTMLIALSEEWMFRGILFHALHSRMGLRPAILLTTLCFGTLHVLNAFAFGDLAMAVAQSVAAMMTGLLLLALMLRTGSIWTAVVYHMLWNFGIVLLAYETTRTFDPDMPLPPSAYLTPMLIVLPNLLYALVLLRGLRKGASATG